jgi:hypothetical protein
MELTPNPAYTETTMKISKYVFVVVIVLGFVFPSSAVVRPTFLIFTEGINLTEAAQKLENQGASIHQQIPPQIVTVDLPDGLNPSSIPSLKSFYVSAVPIDTLQPLGMLAVAAGVQWNRHLLKEAQTGATKGIGMSALNSMRALVSQKSLPAPGDPVLTPQGTRFLCEWKPVSGALYYHLQLSADPSFTKIFQTRTNLTRVAIPTPDQAADHQPLYFRVRAADRPDSEDSSTDIFGAWSKNASATAHAVEVDGALPAPIPTSPVDKFESEGFTVLLEWMGVRESARVQISRSQRFDEPFIDVLSDTPSFWIPSTALHLGDSFYWRVQSFGTKASRWSDVRQFRVGSPHHDQADMLINPEAPK